MTNYDPFAGVKAIGQAGQDISDIMKEAHKAEAAVAERMKIQQGAKFLHEMINHRVEEVGKTDPTAAKYLEFAPFLDPTVQKAAMAVEGMTPGAKDYIGLLRGLSEKNADRLKPVTTKDGVYQWDIKKNQYMFQPNAEAVHITKSTGQTKNGIIPEFAVGVAAKSGKEIFKTQIGEKTVTTITPTEKASAKDLTELKQLEVEKNAAVESFKHTDYNLNDIILRGLPPINQEVAPSSDLLHQDANAIAQGMVSGGSTKQMPDDVRKHAEYVLKTITKYEARAKQMGVKYVPNKQRLEEEVATQILAETGGDPVKARALAKERGYKFDMK